MVAATGVWSKRIAEANERHGREVNGPGMAAASVVLVAVCGLGLKYKLQILREAMDFFVSAAHQRTAEATRRWDSAASTTGPASFASRCGASNADRASSARFAHERERQKEQAQRAWERAREHMHIRGCKTEDGLEKHRALLNIHRDASKAEVKQAYYTAAKRYHPDSVGAVDGSVSNFAELKVAYDTLIRHARPSEG